MLVRKLPDFLDDFFEGRKRALEASCHSLLFLRELGDLNAETLKFGDFNVEFSLSLSPQLPLVGQKRVAVLLLFVAGEQLVTARHFFVWQAV